METKEKITFPEFQEIEKKLDIRNGKIVKVEAVKKSLKMLRLEVSFGKEIVQVITNIGSQFADEEHAKFILTNRVFPFIINLAPAKIMGLESHAMIVLPSTQEDVLDEEYLFKLNPQPGMKLI